MRDHGVRWILMFGRQSYQVEGKHHFWGGLNVEAVGGGAGLVDMRPERAAKVGIDVRYGVEAPGCSRTTGRVTGVVAAHAGGFVDDRRRRRRARVRAGSRRIPEWRTRYLGPNWELARVRGTRHNTGDGIKMALDIGAQPYGHWSRLSRRPWDMNAPPFGDRKVGDIFQKHSYPLGIIVNLHGERFVDEGADFRNYTYVKYGRDGHRAAAADGVPDLRPEGRCRSAARGVPHPRGHQGRGPDHRGAGAQARDRSSTGLVATVRAYNAALEPSNYNPAILDGKTHARDHAAQVELGAAARHAAVRRATR